MAIGATKGQGGELSLASIPVKDGQRYINLNPGRLFVQQPPKKGKGIERLIKIITLVPTTGRQLLHRKTKLNQILQKHACIFN